MRSLLRSMTIPALALCALACYVVCNPPSASPPQSEKDHVEEPVAAAEEPDDEIINDEFDLPVDNADTPAGRRVLVFGDSEACVVRPFVPVMASPNDVVDVACKVSSTVQYWGEQGHMKIELDRFQPDVVIVFLGTNHWGSQKVPFVKPILDLIEERKLACVWVGNTAVRGKHWAINGLLKDAVSPTCSYFDTEAAGIPLPDGIHPAPAAAQRWLQAAWRIIPTRDDKQEGTCVW